MLAETAIACYQCPGEAQPISRSVHLGRLASFYSKCRDCAHRGDTGTLSPRLVQLLRRTTERRRDVSLFTSEGVSGVYLNTLAAPQTRALAAAFALVLARGGADDEGSPSAVVVAGDGRLTSGELAAAAGEGLRWAGRRVIGLGAATAPCVAWAVDRLGAAGGLLVGNGGDEPQRIDLKFWGSTGRPFGHSAELNCLRDIYEAHIDRPTRSYGSLERYRADTGYLAGWDDHFHALRPLRFVLDTYCSSLMGYLNRLLAQSACEIVVTAKTTHRSLSERVATSGADFGVWIDGNGESCRLFDERGREVRHDEWLALIATRELGLQPGATFAIEHGASPSLAALIAAAGGQIVAGDRGAMFDCMRRHGALAGLGSSRRLWFGGDVPAADALKALALLLRVLSESDRSLGEVVERQRLASSAFFGQT